MALGVDQWVAKLCIDNDIPFTAAIPFDGFESRWPERSQLEYRRLLEKADIIHVVSPGVLYSPGLLQTRNRWMIDNSHGLLAVFNGLSGGTANCINYARTVGRWIHYAQIPDDIWAEARVMEEGLLEAKERRNMYILTPVNTNNWDNMASAISAPVKQDNRSSNVLGLSPEKESSIIPKYGRLLDLGDDN
jgi:hypothetical protein